MSGPAGALARLREHLARPTDATGLAAFRVLLGLVLLTQTIRFWANGWIESLWLGPEFHFTWAGLDWIRPLPGPWMYALMALQGLAALGLLLGYRTRASAALFCLAFTYGELIDKALYLNHYYLVSLLTLLCVFLPVGATLSLDARRRGPRLVPQGAYTLLRLQVACVYVFAGLAKLGHDWLQLGEPLRTWLQAHHDLPLVGPLLDTPGAALAMSWAGLLHDLAIVPAVLWARTRAIAFAAAAFFHLAIWLLFPVGVFSFIMLAALTVCLPPTWPRRLLSRLRLASADQTAPVPASPTSTSRLTIALGAAWIALQIALPLRHALYPGDVLWTEQGFRFAWRVMLIEKTGHVDFTITTRSPPGRFVGLTRPDLTPLQSKMMSTQPDMIHDYAHHLAARYRALGYEGVSVFADAWVSLNGRPAARLVDPTADLASFPRGPLPQPWILAPP
ncbi:MAG: HTTM domain-containing protein [Deltaproteobacteria bacterium]|nr:HTTM domain-containing protein [Deltaproteobacteria bacterium]